MGMTNWKRLYTDASRMLDKYQNEVVPKLREQLANCVEVVHGRWEWITEDIYGCTNCGETSRVKEVMGQPAWDYCPCCGAVMCLVERKDNGNSREN